MKVKGILLENEKGEEFLVSSQAIGSPDHPPAFLVQQRTSESSWVAALLPVRQMLAMKALALVGMHALVERCGLTVIGSADRSKPSSTASLSRW